MNKVSLNRFPGGVTRCLTMSYDDGSFEDERLVGFMLEDFSDLVEVSSEMSDQNGKPGCRCVQYVVGDKFKMVL